MIKALQRRADELAPEGGILRKAAWYLAGLTKAPVKELVSTPYATLLGSTTIKMNNLRKLTYLIQSSLFKEVWNEANVFQQEVALRYIANEDRDSLHHWMMIHESVDYEHKTWAALLAHAQWYKIKNYSRMTRVELTKKLVEIRAKR